MHMLRPIRVVIADRCSVMRTGLIATLDAEPGIQVIATAVQGQDLSSLVRSDALDVLVLHPPDTDPTLVTLIHDLRQVHPCLGIVVLAATVDSALDWLGAGVNACVCYTEPAERLQLAIRAAAQGDYILQPALAAHVLAAVTRGGTRPAPALTGIERLSGREHEILRLIAHGYTNHAIADHLNITVATVKRHVSNILQKLDVADRAEAAAKARARGLA